MTRVAKCMCGNCNNVGTVKIPIPMRGNRLGYLCEFHARYLEGYCTENDTRRGTVKVNLFTYSIELETSRSTTQGRGELVNFGFLPTSDRTVDVEYKSPIYEGLNAVSKQLVTIENLKRSHDIAINSDCGTHFHVGHREKINPETMNYIRRFYHSLFIPLSDYMIAHPVETINFWGRAFDPDGWATPINVYTDAYNHTNFINLQHEYTIEFRLAKFQNANQYMKVVKFCRDAVNAVLNNFVEHFNDNDFDIRRYHDITAYRKHKAEMTAQKIVKLYEKYITM